MTTTFKSGDKFIPRKPKGGGYPHLDDYWESTLIVKTVENGWITCTEHPLMYHVDWCEKVEENQSVETNEMVAENHIPEVRKMVDSSEISNNQEHIVEANKMIDWEQRRYELAKSAMQGMTTNEYYLKICASKAEDNKTEWENILCLNAINVADEMIKQLKKNDTAK